MNRFELANSTHNFGKDLTLANNTYKQSVFSHTFLALEKDLFPFGDITTDLLFKENELSKATILAKSNFVLCGIEEVRYFLSEAHENFKPRLSGKFDLILHKQDGDPVSTGDIILEIVAGKKDILKSERTVLNLLSRMSGVATTTTIMLRKLSNTNVLLTPTRKTLWGLLDKKAVFVGGGGTHRLNLSDAILIKDTHLDLLNNNFESLLNLLGTVKTPPAFIELEITSLSQLSDFFTFLTKHQLHHPFICPLVIMLDNMTPSQIIEAITLSKNNNIYNTVLFEASGGINEGNIQGFADSGVDIISSGELTNSSKNIDLTMKTHAQS